MEIEENRGLIDKKAYKDQLVAFFQFIFGVGLKEEKESKQEKEVLVKKIKDKERKGKKRSSKEKLN